jgi:hypothetical protein
VLLLWPGDPIFIPPEHVPYFLGPFFFFPMGQGFELRASHLQSRHSTTWATLPVHFALVILEMGSWKLFAGADLETQSSWSQPPK